jgi:hypothetical protein
MKVKITVGFPLGEVSNWYDGEDLTEKEIFAKLKEDFEDVEILMNHLPKTGYKVNVTKI